MTIVPAIREGDRVWWCPKATSDEVAATIALWRSWGLNVAPAALHGEPRPRPRSLAKPWWPEAAKMYVRGASLLDCATQFKTSMDAISRALRRQGVALRDQRERLSRLTNDEIVAAYHGGENASQIAVRAKLSRERIRQILAKAGVKIKSMSEITAEKRAARDGEIKRLLDEGKTYAEIARAVGATPGTIVTRLREMGLLRGPHGRGPSPRTLRALEMFDDGSGYKEIANALGYKSWASVAAIMHQHGRGLERRRSAGMKEGYREGGGHDERHE